MFSVCQANRGDAKEIYHLQQLAYQSESLIYSKNIAPLKETKEDIEKNIETKTVLKCLEGKKIIGSVQAKQKDGICYISRIMVHPDYQKKGIGKILLTSIEKKFLEARYEVFTGNQSEKTINFYLKMNYLVYKAKDGFLYFRK